MTPDLIHGAFVLWKINFLHNRNIWNEPVRAKRWLNMMKNLIEGDGRNAFLFTVTRILMLRYIYIYTHTQLRPYNKFSSWCSNKTLTENSIKSLELLVRNESSVKVPHMLTWSKPGQACQQGLFWVRVGVERAKLLLMSFNEGRTLETDCTGWYCGRIFMKDLVLFQTRLVGCRGALLVFRASCAAV